MTVSKRSTFSAVLGPLLATSMTGCITPAEEGAAFGTGPGAAEESDSGLDETGGDDEAGALDLPHHDPDGGDCACAPSLDLIHVVSGDGELWAFDPRTDEFTPRGALGCGTLTASSPFSMAVSRSGEAWISFWNGDVLVVDVDDPADCRDPGYDPDPGAWKHFGMAFASDSAADACDDLYVHTIDTHEDTVAPGAGELARFHLAPPTIAPIGDVDYGRGELSGTGDGRLFAFAGGEPARLVEYDKSTGEVVNTVVLEGFSQTSAWAFAFWGGDFYFFTESEGYGSDSKVTHLDYDGSDGNGHVLTTRVAQAPIRVFGAGVSTCAPYVPQG